MLTDPAAVLTAHSPSAAPLLADQGTQALFCRSGAAKIVSSQQVHPLGKGSGETVPKSPLSDGESQGHTSRTTIGSVLRFYISRVHHFQSRGWAEGSCEKFTEDFLKQTQVAAAELLVWIQLLLPHSTTDQCHSIVLSANTNPSQDAEENVFMLTSGI